MKWTLPICGVCIITITGLAGWAMAQNAPPAGPVAAAAPTSQPSPAPDVPLPSGMTRLFDGKTLTGWKQIPADQWIVKYGALLSLGKGRGVIATEGQFSKYRIIFDIRHVSAEPKKDHPACVLFFCTNPAENEKPIDMLGAVQFMIPQGFHWDYRPGKNNSGNAYFTTIAKSKADQWQWSRVELLVDAESGTARLAVAQPPGAPAVELGRFKDPTAGKKGPFAIQMHNAGLVDEYANIAIEENPKVNDLITVLAQNSSAPQPAAAAVNYSPDLLPGRGLLQHDFLLTGEWDTRKPTQDIFLVRGGKVVWSYGIPINDENKVLQELGDATLLSNGNVVFCLKTGASEVTPDKKIIWHYQAEKGTEVHSVQPIGLDKVLIVQNGNPAKMMLIDIKTGQIEKQMDIPTPRPKSAHLQFRRFRLTAAGTYLGAHLDVGRVVEYDADMKEIWSVNAPGCWSASRLKNGNTLMGCSENGVREVNAKGETVWQFTQPDCPDIKLFIIQDVSRLANGNTVLCNWCPNQVKNKADWPKTVQVLEVTPDKKVVWALRSWAEPDLGTASSIQLLDEPGQP